jgi:hypothetical protein
MTFKLSLDGIYRMSLLSIDLTPYIIVELLYLER